MTRDLRHSVVFSQIQVQIQTQLVSKYFDVRHRELRQDLEYSVLFSQIQFQQILKCKFEKYTNTIVMIMQKKIIERPT